MNLRLLTFLFSLLFLASCGNDDEEIQPGLCEDGLISVAEFAAADTLSYTELDNTGLLYYISDSGSVDRPVLTDSVTANYVGFVTNGRIFDQTTPTRGPVGFPLGGVIEGWQLGVPLIGKGGVIRLLIPAELGYGSRGSCDPFGRCSICPDSDLVFDIELVDFYE